MYLYPGASFATLGKLFHEYLIDNTFFISLIYKTMFLINLSNLYVFLEVFLFHLLLLTKAKID